MAFVKYASALLMSPSISQRGWSKVRTASLKSGGNLVNQAEQIFGEKFDPSRYLLSHCTIVASVDVENVSNVKLGAVQEDGATINRKYSDYHITPETSKYVNNNGDSWSREVLMKSYRTFIGSHNFQEHVQIEDLSKGRIIDAVARDIGESIYIDILVATDRKHTELVQNIESGKMATLSMGCTVEATICSQCGNVAVDETEMCNHIKYAKLNKFMDNNGKQRVIAELCGHPEMGDTGGVHFIEASWVAVPAFTGAVMRNILTPEMVSAETKKKATEILSVPPSEWVTPTGNQKVARELYAGMFDDDDDDGGDDKGDTSPNQELEDEMVQVVKKRVQDRLKKELSPPDEPDENAPKTEDATTYQNDTIVKEAMRKGAVVGIMKISTTSVDLIEGLARLDKANGEPFSVDLYRTVLKVGSTTKHKTLKGFLTQCHRTLKRTFTSQEAKQMVRLAKLIEMWERQSDSRS